jgi:predicted RNase H-like nuclease (RuvC/YqgF family)
VFDNYTPFPAPSDVLPSPSCSRKNLTSIEPVDDSLSQELDELRQQLQQTKRQTLVMMEQSRKATEAEKIALQQAREAMADKDATVSEAKKATSRENSMLELMNEAAADISGIFSLNQNSFSLYVVSLLFFEIYY